MILVGIDEAGYGPLLGPLVVSAVAFDVPEALADAPLWDSLSQSVARKVRQRDPRLVITDSKKLSSRPDGMVRLERAALAALSLGGAPPQSLVALLRQLAPHVLAEVQRCRWYADADLPLPAASTRESVATAANALARDLRGAGISFLGAFSEPLTAAAYNRLVASTKNKAVVLFSRTVRLIQRVADAWPGRRLRVYADHQGGKQLYGNDLMRAFELPTLRILEETRERSAYALDTRPADCTIEFIQKGEDHHLPIALASIFAKYQRELFMILLNRFFQAHRPDLKPTKGYYTDGKRFLEDIRDDLPALGIDPDALVRTK